MPESESEESLCPKPVSYTHLDVYKRQECARLAVSFAAASLDLQPETLCRRVYTEIERRIFLGVSQMLLEHAHPYFRKNGLDEGIKAVLELQWNERHKEPSGLLHLGCSTPATLIGIGGPIHLFLKAAADALHAPCVIPDHASTANAVSYTHLDVYKRQISCRSPLTVPMTTVPFSSTPSVTR